jgi:hypothetical protein
MLAPGAGANTLVTRRLTAREKGVDVWLAVVNHAVGPYMVRRLLGLSPASPTFPRAGRRVNMWVRRATPVGPSGLDACASSRRRDRNGGRLRDERTRLGTPGPKPARCGPQPNVQVPGEKSK